MAGKMPIHIHAAALALAAEAAHAAQHVPFPVLPRTAPCREALMRVRQAIVSRPVPESQSLPGATWRDIALPVRTTLVMLASDQPGDPRVLACQPWESFTDKDRAAIAAAARDIAHELRHAATLY